MDSDILTDEQRKAFARIVATAREVMVGACGPVTEADLEGIGRVFAEALRQYGVPCTRARAYLEDGELMAEAMIVAPLGFG